MISGEVRPSTVGFLERLDRALAKIEELLVFASGALVLFLMLYGTVDVLSRTILNRPLPSTYEYMQLGMVGIVYLGVAQVQRLQGHVAVDFVSKHFPPPFTRILAVLSCLVGLLLMGVIIWWGAIAAWESYIRGEYIGSVARVPVLPARLALVTGVSVLFLRLLLEMVEHLAGRRPASSRPVPE